MSNALTTLTSKLASRLDIGDGAGLIETLKATAFKGQVSDAQMTALLVVANQYGLNPWTKEIYAFPDQNNGIVPVVGVDGWARIINGNDKFDGMEFVQDDESCTCIIFRKDRTHPIKVTEYLSECRREVKPWKSHPKRMLRHKAMIQCARLAFGFGGIYDQDEAERIVEVDVTGQGSHTNAQSRSEPVELQAYSSDSFRENLPKWKSLINQGKKTADDIIATVSSKAILSEEQIKEIRTPLNIDSDGVIDLEVTKAYEAEQ
jgi:phage recombination protein Bet